MRIETVVNAPNDLGVQRRLCNLPELQVKARAANRRLLDNERAGQGCVLASPAFERVALPTVDDRGRRASALRFGDPRVQALAGALSALLMAVTGITNRSLRARMATLTGQPYSANQASYDLGRLSRKQLIRRIPDRNRYALTDEGIRFAVFYTKLHDRLLVPLMSADQPPAPPPLRAALRVIAATVDDRIDQARLRPAP